MMTIGVRGQGPGARILEKEISDYQHQTPGSPESHQPRTPDPGPRTPDPRPLTTVAFATVGCKLNQYETSELQGMMEARGFRTVPFDAVAQIYVINSCTVTSKADFSDRQMIRRAAAKNPNALVVVIGCYAQTNPDAIAKIPGVDLIIGNQEKFQLLNLLESLEKQSEPVVRVGDVSTEESIPVAPLPRSTGRTRAFVKVQDGCQHRCAFCIVPLARGGSRSQDPKVILGRVRELVEAGHQETVLTGVDIGHYGWDLLPRTTLAALLREMGKIQGLRWIRLSSVLSQYFTEELREMVTRSEKICPHQHIPLQSGSDRVLRAMRRPYNTAMYRRLVEKLYRAVPDLGLGTDVIVGFPGETEEEFEETYAFVESLPFTYLHVFSYSPRKGTEATRLPDPVPPGEIKRRSARLRSLGHQKNLAFRRRFLGRAVELLVLESRDKKTGLLTGLTGHYIEVLFPGEDRLMQSVRNVRIADVQPDRTVGALV
ncbi:MAG TPA: tRNA (N(6)-L-threonylcarbamoyladenosine(37)-C(2))-methylthiotransferase MtaB [Methylomirabilota bacterium]|nr:tRNA (N(6)-L-threonylcarbamoyladenosine(37)-C(2))-methylthiotransferase MtaB [Methylomirabilota bacterium]